MSPARLWVLQRITAMILAPLVLVHLATIVYASRGGLSATEILGRTEGHVGLAAVYALFVVAAAIHGAIGCRVVLGEWARLRGPGVDGALLAGAVMVAMLGLRTVWVLYTGSGWT